MSSIRFNAVVCRNTMDEDGETKITFRVPLSDLHEVAKLKDYVQKNLIVEIAADPANG